MAITKKCIICGTEFRRRGKAALAAKACSRKCFHKSKIRRSLHKCLFCGKEFYRTPSELKKNKTGKLFCSRDCAYKVMVPVHHYEKGHIPWSKGRKRPEVTGSNNTEWRGDEVGYHGLHRWIWKHFGKPSQCDHCGITTGKFEWANKTGEYKRNINDWLRLCTKCHGYYDSNKSGIGIRGSSVTRFGKYYK